MMNSTTDADPHRQGEFITPVRAVVNCYDMDDFTRAPVDVGTRLIKETRAVGELKPLAPALQAGFVTWNRIRIAAPESKLSSARTPAINPAAINTTGSRLQITLNQAYHTGWSSPDCELTRGDEGNLLVNCPSPVLQARPVDLVFFEPISALGARVSVRSATILGGAGFALGLMSLVPRRRAVARPAA